MRNPIAISYCTLVISLSLLMGCQTSVDSEIQPNQVIEPDRYNVAFLIMDGVYNTELTAPFDIFHHTRFREGIKPMNVFMVAETMEPVLTFEGIKLLPDFSFDSETLPKIDILVVPSAEHHLDSDLQNDVMLDFVTRTSKSAEYVTSHCDGAFVLAQTGILDNAVSTTFPADVESYKKRYPHLVVMDSVLFVHDGKFITSAGGAKSFEAALYLTDLLYGEAISRDIAKGLVIDWNVSDVPHHIEN